MYLISILISVPFEVIAIPEELDEILDVFVGVELSTRSGSEFVSFLGPNIESFMN